MKRTSLCDMTDSVVIVVITVSDSVLKVLDCRAVAVGLCEVVALYSPKREKGKKVIVN